MKKSILVSLLGILIVGFPLLLQAEITPVQDTLYSNDTWSDTIQVMSDILIADDVTLTIEPGTRVEFQGSYVMMVHGTVLAVGTKQDTIVFTRSDTAGYWDESVLDGGWNGIFFNNANYGGGAFGAMHDNDTSVFRFCRIEFVKTNESAGWTWSAISVNVFSRLVIRNSELRYNYASTSGGAIGLSSESDIKILFNHIHHNRAEKWGGAIYSQNNATKIIGNLIEYNETIVQEGEFGRGGGIGLLGMNPEVRDNLIRYNRSVFGSGIHMRNCFGIFEGNRIVYNTGFEDPGVLDSWGGGIYCDLGSTAKFINNRIANNYATNGGGFNIKNSDVHLIGNLIVNNTGRVTSGGIRASEFRGIIVNNTIAHNDAEIAGAFELEDGDPLFSNNILWNNPDNGNRQVKLLGPFAKLHMVNCVVEGGLTEVYGEGEKSGENLITDYPEFADSTVGGTGSTGGGLTGKWFITSASLCINAGNNDFTGFKMPPKDVGQKPRIQHTYIDIGAYEYYVKSMVAADTIKTNTTWIADTVHVHNKLVVNDDVTLTILPGTIVKFHDTTRVYITGTLVAVGEKTKPIRFMAADTGTWKGIQFNNNLPGLEGFMNDNDSSRLEYCEFSDVRGLGEWDAHNTAAVYIAYYDDLVIKNGRFFNNYFDYEAASIYLEKSTLGLIDCEFHDNFASQGPALRANASDIMIENCSFHDNYAMHQGGAIMTGGASEMTIKKSSFVNNACGNNGGAIQSASTRVTVSLSYFSNNRANNRGGAVQFLYENFRLINNVFSNNSSGQGGAVYFGYVDDAFSLNNTVVHNHGNWGGGMYNFIANHTSLNDIYYGNEAANGGNQYAMKSSTSELTFKNINLGGGLDDISIHIGTELNGEFKDLLDTVPEFFRPSDGAGADFDGSAANWGLKSISPLINYGTFTGASQLEDIDIRGNPRIHDTLIDLGAIENQWGLPVIEKHPDNFIGCAGDTISLWIGERFKSLYQWQKDGEDIPGANERNLTLNNISQEDAGNYRCIVRNSFGSVFSNPAYVVARSAPEFLRQPVDIWAVEGEKTILNSTGVGTQPIHFQWYKDGIMIPGKTWPDLWINNTGAGDEGLYHCEARNACAAAQSDTVQLYLAPQICMVTVDTATDKNLIIWEKPSSAPIASFNIYRESVVAGEYDLIGNVDANALSEFTDTVADPASQAYIYKITAVTADGAESDINLSTPHKTIHLLATRNLELGVPQLDWDYYYGFDYGTFYIYKFDSSGTLTDTILKSSSTATWLDSEALPFVKYFYRVAVQRANLCTPTETTKAGTGPYSHALSNLDDNKLKQTTSVGDISGYGSLRVYPNPFSERATVEFNNPDYLEYRVIVRDLSGKTVIMDRTNMDQYLIERGNLGAGIYVIELLGKKVYRERIMIR